MDSNTIKPYNIILKFDSYKKFDKNSRVIKPNTGVSILTCTNRQQYMGNILKNYCNQNWNEKELIIILNNNKLNIHKWRSSIEKYSNVMVYQLEEKITLGECLNYGVKKAKFEIIAKFDDDDYYGPNYLSNSIKAFNYTDADVIGKYTTYIYFEQSKILAIRNPKRENRYVYRVEGPTLIFKKHVFEKVKFVKRNLGEDIQFCKDCIKKGFKIYSTNKKDFVYIRHNNTNDHTWKIKDDYYMKSCNIIGYVDDFSDYVN